MINKTEIKAKLKMTGGTLTLKPGELKIVSTYSEYSNFKQNDNKQNYTKPKTSNTFEEGVLMGAILF